MKKRLFGLCILLLTVCAGSAFAEPATVTGSAPGMESVITATITIQRIFCVSKHSMKITKIPVNSAVEAARDNTSHIISWAEMYDTASMEAKKMIVNCLIKRVDVYRDYKLHIDFNIDFEQFCGGLDIVTIAA